MPSLHNNFSKRDMHFPPDIFRKDVINNYGLMTWNQNEIIILIKYCHTGAAQKVNLFRPLIVMVHK